MTKWHCTTLDDTLQQLDTDASRGLTTEQVEARRHEYGLNELIETGGRSPWRILWEQLSGAMVLLLVFAAIVSMFLHEYTDAIAIMAIVLLNAGFFVE